MNSRLPLSDSIQTQPRAKQLPLTSFTSGPTSCEVSLQLGPELVSQDSG